MWYRRKRRVLSRVSFHSLVLPVHRVFSSALLPGFPGPVSSVLRVNLSPSAPLPASGFPYRVGFSLMSFAASHDRAGGSPWVRRTASPDAVRLHIGSVHRISGLALSRLLDLLPNAIEPVRCSLRTWVLPHTSSGPAISDDALVLLVWLFRPVTASVLLPATPEGQRMRHARRTYMTTASSRPGESHPWPLTEPYVTISRHTALVTQPYLHMPSSQ